MTTPAGTVPCPVCGGASEAFSASCPSCGAAVAAGATGATADQEARRRDRVQAAVGSAYVLLDEVGRGGMGIVFRALETALGREVALKVLAFDPVLAPQAFERFEREARLAAQLDHPHIVPIFSVGHLGDVAFYTMRYVRGGSLEGALDAGRAMAPDRALPLLRQVAAALDHAHARGVVHRDIKPANVLLADPGHALVGDFGIARAVHPPGEGGPGGTASGVVGSPAYMAPEQWRAEAVDGRADQYALAIVAFELLTGERPFRGAGVQDLLRMHLLEEPPDLTAKRPDLARGVAVAIRRGMSKDPEDRYPTAGALVDAIDAGLAGRAVAGAAPRRAPQEGGATATALAPPLAARWVLVVGALRVLTGGVALAVRARPAAEARLSVAAPAPMVVTVPETVVVERRVPVPAPPAAAPDRGVIADTGPRPPTRRELLRADPERARALRDQAARERLRARQEDERRRLPPRPPSW